MAVEKASPAQEYGERSVARISPVRGYGVGMWAWLLQRATGVLLVVVVFIHFWAKVLVPTWGIIPRVADMIMIALVTYHAFSGIRTVLVDLGIGVRTQRIVFFATVVLAALTMAAALRAYQVRFFG